MDSWPTIDCTMCSGTPALAAKETNASHAAYHNFHRPYHSDRITRVCPPNPPTADPIPLCNWYDSTTENGQFISNADDFYLAFMSTGSQSEDGIDRYGWFHVALDDNMEMSILESGIGLYGENIYVGATPEPTAGLLLLLGSAFLALRRRKAA